MSLGLASLILIGGLMLVLATGAEIAVAIGTMGSIGLLFIVDKPLNQFAYTAWSTMYSFTLTCIPIFVFMGAMFSSSGVLRKLFDGAQKLVGWLPGGIANSVIGANAIFGAISGSSLAATATFGKLALPEMERLGYDPKLSLGSIAVSGVLSALIPPSLVLIVYGGWLNVSVSRLFAGGLIPGVLLAAMLMIQVTVTVKLYPHLAPKAPQYTIRQRLGAVKDILPFIAVIFAVLGVIFAGIMTPTEAASIGALCSVVMAFLYRRMTFITFQESMLTAVKVTSMLAFLLFTASVLAQVFQYVGLTKAFGELMLSLPFGKYGVLILVVLLYLVLGCFFDAFSMLILTVPFVGPLMSQLGFNSVWFGVVFTILALIGVITPPFGLHLFILKAVAPKYSIGTIIAGSFPLLLPLFVLLVLITAFPQLVLWLPSVLY